MPIKPALHEGKTLKEHARIHGVSLTSLYTHVNVNGESVQEAILAMRPKTRYMYEGVSLHEYCKNNNHKYTTVCHRIRKGMSVEEAIKKKTKTHKFLMYKGISLYQYCEENGLNYGTIYTRIRNGLSTERAIEIKEKTPLVSTKTEVTIDSVTRSVKEWCLIEDISFSTVYNRVVGGLSIIQAITAPISRGASLTIGVVTHSIEKWCKIYDKPRETVRYRIDVLEMTPLEALLLPPIKQAKYIQIGNEIKMQSDWCKQYKVDLGTVIGRMKRLNIPFEKAIKLKNMGQGGRHAR